MSRSTGQRYIIGLAALLTWLTLAARLHIAAEDARAQGENLFWGMLTSFVNFTLITTLFAALALTTKALNVGGRWRTR